MYNKWTALPEFGNFLATIVNNQQTTATAAGHVSDEDEEDEECMDDENGSDRLSDEASSEIDSMDDDTAGVHMLDAPSSDGVSVDDSAASGDQLGDEEMTSDENNGAVSSGQYILSLFGLNFQMDSIPSDENTDGEGIDVPIEVAVFSR
ncbi:unnamed protein product, partial [Rotaria sp. Silwood2]